MKLEELLYVLGKDTYVGIWDIRRTNPQYPTKHEKHPTRQTYSKVCNLPYGEIKDLLRCDVLGINVVDDGLLIRLYDKARLDRRELASEITRELKRAFPKESE